MSVGRKEDVAETSRIERKKVAAQKETCAKISDVEARNRKLEAIERQLHYLIGQVRQLKTT